VTGLDLGSQVWFIVLAGAGMGFMLGPASTDAVNRASRLSYGEATGITQTVRNYSASLGFAVLGTVLLTQLHTRVTDSLVARGLPPAAASHEASSITRPEGDPTHTAIPHFIRLDFAQATRVVLLGMAGIMAAAAVVALLGLRAGVQAEEPDVAPGTST